ncbi:MAG: glutamate--cysteine ligase [Clostridiaceae bacterium]|jgi:glutamate--cysteine ligase|nr:glutamate--cysteine ligase [Clostridiaceae bacterium]
MDFYEENKRVLVKHFEGGAKNKKSLGLELEHFVVKKADKSAASYYESGGIEDVLKALSSFYDEKIYSDGHLAGLKRDKCLITLEPAAQLEVSAGEFLTTEEIAAEYEKFRIEAEPILNAAGLELMLTGYQPKSRVRELPLIPKLRYRMMDNYFASTGSRGINMMRGTAATQVSVDYSSEADFIGKFRLANAITPLLAFITDNAPVFEGEAADKRMIRTYVWEDVDRDRSMFVPGALTKPDFGFGDYADYILNAPAILVIDGGGLRYTGGEKIRDIYGGRVMTEAEAEHVLSMFFPYVRLKSFIEIRMADSLPVPEAVALTALAEGLFYGGTLAALVERFSTVTDDDAYAAFEELKQLGSEACVYGAKATELIDVLFDAAATALNKRGAGREKLLLPLSKRAK